jgi:hypothetical protein
MRSLRLLLVCVPSIALGACGPSMGSTESTAANTPAATASSPTVNIRSIRSNVPAGGITTLIWSSANTTACEASGAWSGDKPVSGTQSTGPLTAAVTYSLRCSGTDGAATGSVTVSVPSDASSESTPIPADTPTSGRAPTSGPAKTLGQASCSSTSGSLALKASAVRESGISPLLAFFDATGTTDSSLAGNTTAFQDVAYTWNFGDFGPSGAATWRYGANPGKASRNTAGGAVAAHLYTTGADTAYTVTVTAYDGKNTAVCGLTVTAYDPAGAKGFAGKKTTCVSASEKPAAGTAGCPAGAAVLQTASFNTALDPVHLGSGKRVLFKCGDTFTGDHAALDGTTWSVGAYGGCEGTQAGRPILRDSGIAGELEVSLSSGDGRIADLDLEGNGTASSGVGTPGGNSRISYQMTLYNLRSSGNSSSYSWSQGAQWGLIDSVMTGMRTSIGTFANYNENNPRTWSGNVVNNLDYQAMLGNDFNGAGAPNNGSGLETVRISAGRFCVIENNTFKNANDVGATLKVHNGNTNNSSSAWTGIYTEFLEISGNWFGGISGAQYVETSPQNAGDDERLRNIVFEGNVVSGTTGVQGGRQILVSAVNETVRNNVFYMPGDTARYPIYAVQAAQRGIEPPPSGIEAYNNTCYAPNAVASQGCIGFTSEGGLKTPPTKSSARNNLFHIPDTRHFTVADTGIGNTVSNNTSSPADNPAFANRTGNFSSLPDFKPGAKFSGAAAVPVWYDALGESWAPTWDLGALHH